MPKAVALLLAGGSLAFAAREAGTVRRGPDRDRIAYQEPHAREKAALVSRINEDRRAAGLPPVEYDLMAARVGDEFCAAQAASGVSGHWDTQGRGPHLRYALAGGVDFEAENFASRTRYGGRITESVGQLLIEAHESFMSEKPPANGHKETILDAAFTHVGIGAAVQGGEFRMTEEFVRRAAEWVEVPAAPVAAGSRARVSMKLFRPWRPGVVEIAWEPPPHPLTSKEIAARGSYSYPPALHTMRPLLPGNAMWQGGGHGDFQVATDGRVDFSIPLDHGPGSYFVIAYVGQSVMQPRLAPATAALVVAE
jgi:uncharacterized protein YkwD